jgi:hypothetical protein
MDGSKYFLASEGSDATRVALRVDRDAVGLMKHASQLSHLVEWWLQGAADAIDAMAAFRIGRRLERFRLAARLAEGKSSNQVKLALDGLRSELSQHEVPTELQAEIDAALQESQRLKAATEPPPTLVREALAPDLPLPTGPRRAPPATRPPRRVRVFWLVLLLAVSVAAWWTVGGPTLLAQLGDLFARR